MPKLTFKKEASERGLARVCQGPRGYEIKLDGKRIGSISANFQRIFFIYWSNELLGYYNSSNEKRYWNDKDSAKKWAMNKIKELLKNADAKTAENR